MNLSKRDLSNNQVRALSRGLKFCPTPKEIFNLKLFKLIKDTKDFSRKMKCKAYFLLEMVRQEEQALGDNISWFKEKSNCVPTNVEPVLELFLKNLEEGIKSRGGSVRDE